MLIKRKVFFLLISIAFFSLTLTGCYDLGDGTENDEEYCETYSEIRLIDSSSGVIYYTMEDFYNKEAVNDFKSPMSEEQRKEYTYLFVEVGKKLSIGEVAIYFDSTVEETVQASFFILDESELPTKVYSGENVDEDESDEPSEDKVLGRALVKLPGVAGKWDAVHLKSWKDGEESVKRRDVESGQFLVVRIDNNRYDPALKKLNAEKQKYVDAEAQYKEKLEAWQEVNNKSDSTQEQKNAAMDALAQATATKNVAERDYGAAQTKYNKEKFPYKKVPIRVTAILINAE